MKTIRELEQDKKDIFEQQMTSGYSFPRHQMKEIDDQIKRQRSINCGRVCPHCQANGCHYGIESGSYVYYCPSCDNLITK